MSLAAAAAVVLIGNAAAGERGADLRVGGPGAAVFVGPDSAMPVGSTFEISITPTTSARGAVLRPKDVRGAIVELRKALPHWYQRALMASNGDRQCSVVLPRGDGQDVAYGALIDDWWWDNWGLAKPGNPLRRSFAAFGIRKEDTVRNALSVAVCTYIKSGDLNAAVAEVRKYDERPGKG